MSENELIRRGLKNIAAKAIRKAIKGMVAITGIGSIVFSLITGAFMCI